MYSPSAKFDMLIDWFTPDHLKQADGELGNVRLFVICNLLAPIVALPVALFLLVHDTGSKFHLWVQFASFAAFWVFPFALKLFPRAYVTLALFSTQNITFTVLWGAHFHGGFGSPFLMWILVVPLLAFLYLGPGKRNQILIFGQMAISFMVFCGHYNFVGLVPDNQDDLLMVGFAELMTLLTLAFVFLLARYYADGVAARIELTSEIKQNRRTLAELSSARDGAEKANSAKSEFLAKMSHELRTPLNAVLGYSEMLLEDAEVDGRVDEIADLQKISAAGKHLLSMVNDILDISKIEAGKAELYPEDFSLDQFFQEVKATAHPLASKNQNAFVFDKGGDLGSVRLDATKLRQSVLNLLSNAAKFTKDGTITMSVRRIERSDGDWITISVRDTGIGISEDQLNNLFQNFSQADASINAKFGGTGLGLSLSQNLCHLMGGKISVESEPGNGSCFTIELPAHIEVVADPDCDFDDHSSMLFAPSDEADGETEVPPATEPLSEYPDQDELDEAIGGLRRLHAQGSSGSGSVSQPRPDKDMTIMVIDDDKSFLNVTKRVLEREGYCAVCVDTPAIVLQLAMTVKPQIILLDVVMPGLDGWDVLATLKSQKSTRHIPVVMISNTVDREKARRNDAAGFIEKPLDGKKVKTLVEAMGERKELCELPNISGAGK